MKLFQRPWKLSDDEYIERARRSVARLERYRFWWYLYFVILLLGAAWLANKFLQVLLGMLGNAPAVWAGFATGAAMGLVFSSLVYGMFHSAIQFMVGFRSDRLLVKYYDAFREVVHGVPSGTDPLDSDFAHDEQNEKES
jgi:hypothetical protein